MTHRIDAIDMARGIALANMVAFHFLFDLRMFGYAPGWFDYGAWFDLWAKGIAGGFILLAGLGLWLAHGHGLGWRGFLRRLAVLVAAAAAVSVATYVAVPGAWVQFGILHSIALGSVLALPFLRLPWWATALVAAGILWWGPGIAVPAFDAPWLVWTGLGTTIPPMIDYEPVIPWVAPMLLGVALGRLGDRVWRRLGNRPGRSPSRPGTLLAWAGRHSLAVYLVHQPILIGLILGVAWLAGQT
ncbi:DUF1624 domain-containing protein [Jannaschia sp. S6380]|uniref:heparan-alpha-glucosaminide N-acetyltransferase n=1 Tax=Jannaschia sp. S6380 TaxID=2926408 RepID=UPI001FF1F63C|nr:DUF1624 domain-containing protein [Jannaschia sp. S6380]